MIPSKTTGLRQAALILTGLSLAWSWSHLSGGHFPDEAHLWVASVSAGGLFQILGENIMAIDLVALGAIGAMTYVGRDDARIFSLAFAAGLLLLGAYLIGLLAITPVDRLTADWRAGDVPSDFASIRTNWEFAHFMVGLAKLGVVGALYLAVPESSERVA